MNKLILGFSFLMAGSVAFAADTNMTTMYGDTNTTKPAMTNMKSNWICTTNASSSDKESDKTADDKMAKTKNSAKEAFTFASKHCRDCTKITCEVQADQQQ